MKFIITGHGNFATGLASSVKLITGLEKALVAVDFEESMSSDDLKETLAKNVDSSREDVLIFTDIAGGTPFNQSVLLKGEKDNINIIAGTNLPILIEAVLSQDKEADLFVDNLIDSGQTNMKKYKAPSKNRSENIDNNDGI